MNRFFTKFFRSVLVLVFLHGQLAFAVPGIVGLVEAGGNRHVDATKTELHQGHHQARSDAGKTRDHDHDQHEKHAAHGDCDTQCDHSCKGDGCCSACNACGHCSTAVVST